MPHLQGRRECIYKYIFGTQRKDILPLSRQTQSKSKANLQVAALRLMISQVFCGPFFVFRSLFSSLAFNVSLYSFFSSIFSPFFYFIHSSYFRDVVQVLVDTKIDLPQRSALSSVTDGAFHMM